MFSHVLDKTVGEIEHADLLIAERIEHQIAHAGIALALDSGGAVSYGLLHEGSHLRFALEVGALGIFFGGRLLALCQIDEEIICPSCVQQLVGKDSLGEQILGDCRQHKIDVRHLSATTKAPTSYTDVMTEQTHGRRTFFHARGANALWRGDDLDFAKTTCRLFHLGYLLLLDALRRSADRPPLRDALAVGAVTRDAVLAVQLLALRARQGDGGDGQGNGCVLFHDCLHAMSTMDATPSRRTMTR